LLGLRERFPADAHAATAAFLPGRSAAEQEHDDERAARWFSVYLAEQPAGVLAGDALMRLAETRAQGDVTGARAAARRYLELEPDGPHATRAPRLAD
jgi:TolA-binding protein